ncbi:MAG: symmetrical bis(5'-nucleosyl)-tetraphosphatase [Zetaproteobacteria bacterium]|nr:MAG: symmetrical bis(5'-nucleosyl)-tetraphosphatase [Zetaproteobacteria bacterium]
MSIYAVGDIQGCVQPLKRLLDRVAFDPACDQLWCVGDLVNRGPDSLAVLRLLKELGSACVAVLGNHDLSLLGLMAASADARWPDCLREVREADDRDALCEWLRHRPLVHRDRSLGWCMVHAGLHPAWNIAEVQRRAQAVEQRLRGPEWRKWCVMLARRRAPEWAPDDVAERALFDAAVFTRARYCTAEGRFNWRVRAGASAREGDAPWYAHPSLRWRGEMRIVFGHWAARGLVLDQPHVLGLDSGCVWGGTLTLAELMSGGHYRIVASQPCEACQKPG